MFARFAIYIYMTYKVSGWYTSPILFKHGFEGLLLCNYKLTYNADSKTNLHLTYL